MTFPDKVQQLDERIAEAVRGALKGLREEIDDRLRQNTAVIQERLEELESALGGPLVSADDLRPLAEESASSARREAFASLLGALAAIDGAASQAGVLTALLEQAGRFSSRAALFLTRAEAARGWGAYGFSDSDQAVADLVFDLAADSPWARLAEGRGVVELSAADSARLSSRLESQVPQAAILVPLTLGGRLAAALYADRLAETDSLDVEALQVLVFGAALALETLPLRRGGASPTLAEGERSGPPLALWEPPAGEEPLAAEEAGPLEEAPPEAFEEAAAAEAPPAGEEEVLSAFEVVEEQAAPDPGVVERAAVPEEEAAGEEEPLPWEEAAEEAPAWEAAEEVEAAEAPPAWEEGEEVAAAEASPEAPFSEEGEPAWTAEVPVPPWPEAPPPWPAEEPEPEEYPVEAVAQEEAVYEPAEAVEEEDVAATAELGVVAPDIAEDETILLSRPAPAAAPAPTPPPPAGGPAEVRPPSGFTGPGLAFSRSGQAAPAADQDAQHEEGRRLARLLVSEIRLYNEDEVEEGKRNRDLYLRLKDEIDRSRRMYDERIDEAVRSSRDYFSEELVRILADGDADALGSYPPAP